jgi:hypothetical protein
MLICSARNIFGISIYKCFDLVTLFVSFGSNLNTFEAPLKCLILVIVVGCLN